MSKFSIESAIEKSTVDGKLDASELMKAINEDYVNPIVASKKPNLDKIKEEAKSEWIQGLGFEGIDSESKLKAYVKQSSDESKEDLTQLETRYNELEEKYNTLETSYKGVNDTLSTFQRKDKLFNDNFNGDIDYSLYKINQLVSEEKDFDTAYAEYKESNQDLFAPKKVVSTTGKGVNPSDINSKMGWEAILEERTGVKIK